MNLLKTISSILPVAHKEAIKQIFEQLKKQLPSFIPREAEFEANRLAQKVGRAKGSVVLDSQLAVPGERISSEAHNENMEDAFIDLNALYKETGNLNSIQESHKTSLDSDFSKARAAILKLINDARIFAIRNRRPEFDDIKVIDFNIESNKSKNSPIAIIDSQTRLLKLPELLRRRNHLRRRGLRSTDVAVELIAEGQVGQIGKQFGPQLAVDSKKESFWAETVYTDDVFENTYTRWSPNEDGALVDVVRGPIAKLRLNFSNAEAINQVKILPFSNFPVRVLEVTYRSSRSSDLRRTIEGFKTEESLDWMEFNFEAIFAVDVEIVLAQESYRNFIIHVPKHILFATDFMLELFKTRGEEFSTNLPVLEDIQAGGNSKIYQNAVENLSSLMGNKDLEKLPSTEIDLAGKTIMSVGESMAAFNPDLQTLMEEISSYTDSIPEEVKEEIETINKLEYVIGVREAECNFITYSPIGFYESAKLETASTVTNAQLEIEERHPKFQSSYGNFFKTSTEWEIEFAEDRRIPIFPANLEADGLFPVRGEFLDIDADTKVGLSRFPSQLSFAVIRENSSILIAGQDYTIVWDSNFDGKLQISINDSTFDKRKVYTVDYFAKPASAEVDVLAQFADKPLPFPEPFTDTGPDNEIRLENYPFIDYAVINSTGFLFDSNTNAYTYIAPTAPYSTGFAIINPNWNTADGSIIAGLTGIAQIAGLSGTGVSPAGPVLWDTLDADYLNDPYRWFLKITDVPGAIYEVSNFSNSSGLSLTTVPLLYTGLVGVELQSNYFSGNVTSQTTGALTGTLTVPYSLEVVYKAGDKIFGFDNVLYEPISVLVGGTKAANITDYINLEQPAFTISNQEDGEFEYIHDGKDIFFNQAIGNAEILVDYRWMTKYVKVNCTIRTNKLVSPTITPQVNEYRLLMNTTIL